MPYSQIQKGTLLIATPDIETGIFFRSVVLICEHNQNGSFGLVLNKPINLTLPDDIITLDDKANSNVSIRTGGPVQTNQMMLLHDSNRIPGQTLEICDGVFLGGDVQFLQEVIAEENGPHVILCFGYSGWSGGLLEREFLDGHWYLFPASSYTIFDMPPEKMWQNLLKKMGGKYSSLAMIPEDLSLN